MRKTIRGHAYWYAVESKRVNGKPRIVWQRYLGKMEDIIARCLDGPGAYDVVVYEFGAIAAVLSIAERLGLEGIVDRHVPKGQQEAEPVKGRETLFEGCVPNLWQPGILQQMENQDFLREQKTPLN